ncbi:hypothetical protein [Qipengyuania sp. ASV99]|uniref:hypothetical protein n=1 Tax=Qipengyuania sp. ASV99 TaxID=3399681 RepID=UPI003A4C54E9
MIALFITSLFFVTSVAVLCSLADSWLRASGAYRSLMREQALLDAGFVPQIDASEQRLRTEFRRTMVNPNRPYARRRAVGTIRAAV